MCSSYLLVTSCRFTFAAANCFPVSISNAHRSPAGVCSYWFSTLVRESWIAPGFRTGFSAASLCEPYFESTVRTCNLQTHAAWGFGVSGWRWRFLQSQFFPAVHNSLPESGTSIPPVQSCLRARSQRQLPRLTPLFWFIPVSQSGTAANLSGDRGKRQLQCCEYRD